MEKITIASPEAKSSDIVSENIAALKTLFPEAFAEDGVDFDVLKQLLGGAVNECDEKYSFVWSGKRQAKQLALTPSLGTLRPAPTESVHWGTTQNIFIEGDNLEALKIIQKSYAGKVKLIYIDPPYNTGNDFVYPDDYTDSINNYLHITGQKDEKGNILTSNPATSGRYHTDWLNMIYPRICLARNLLREDGIIFISIDDKELANLRRMCDEVFGEENFIAIFVWKSRQNKDNRSKDGSSKDHEYIICYGRTIRGSGRDHTQYANPDGDPRGDWASANMVGLATKDRRPNLHYDLIDPATEINYGCPAMGWRYDRNTMGRLINEERIIWPPTPDGRPRRKAFLNEISSEFTGYSTIIGEEIYTRNGTSDINDLFSFRAFDFPKPVALLSEIVQQGSGDGDIVLDFFAGSGTTGHAVMLQNAMNNEDRRFILVQLPEPLDVENREQKTLADFCTQNNMPCTIAELTKERLRKAAEKVISTHPEYQGDLGFRVFKLDSSNIRPWNPDAKNIAASLLDYTDNLLPGRTEQDLLYEVMLKLGLDLTTPMQEQTFNGHTTYGMGQGALFACLSKKIPTQDVEAIALGITAWRKELNPVGETTVIFRDSAFENDIAKSNMTAILEQYGINNVRSL